MIYKFKLNNGMTGSIEGMSKEEFNRILGIGIWIDEWSEDE